jgi:hypothetical protein
MLCKKNIVMTGKEIQQIICKDMVLSGHVCVAENISFILNHELDVMSMTKTGYMYEYEVKISRSDFHADKKKIRKQQNFVLRIEKHIPNYFSYVVPQQIHEVPEYAGLYYISNGLINEQKKPKLLHRHKHDIQKIQKKLVTVYQERTYLGNCLMTYKNKMNRKYYDEIMSNEVPTAQVSDTTGA